MEDSDINSLKKVLDRTPKVEPFYSEVQNAIENLKYGDLSDNPLFSIIHGHIGALAKSNRLTEDWEILKVNEGLVISHIDFLMIQDNFNKIEGKKIKWNSEYYKIAMKNYIGKMIEFRQFHTNYFYNSRQHIDNGNLKVIDDLVKQSKHFIKNDDFLIVAMPSHLDNPQLWRQFNLSDSLLSRIPPWAKINEKGVILGSQLYRDDNPIGHDYFSYAARFVKSGEIKSIDQKLLFTAQHEGSHGIVDSLLIRLLNLSSDNPIYEGITGALGHDGRELTQSPSLDEMISNPYPHDTKLRSDTIYYSGAKYWTSIYRVLTKGDNIAAWPLIFAKSLEVAVDMNKDPDIMLKDDNSKISEFLKNVIVKLNIRAIDLEREYNLLHK